MSPCLGSPLNKPEGVDVAHGTEVARVVSLDGQLPSQAPAQDAVDELVQSHALLLRREGAGCFATK